MFKQLKTALFWYYLYKFRKRVVIIVLLLLIVIFANSIYIDIVEYLKLKNKLQYLEVAILVKWLIILFNITFSIYLILSIFKRDDAKKENFNVDNNEKFSSREEKFLYKKKLRTKADFLVEK